MEADRLDSHKKILGILYIISAALTILGMLLLNAILSLIFSFAFEEMNEEERRIMELVMSIVQYLPFFIIVFISAPTMIAGIGLLMRQSWATVLAMIMGCLKLFSFPIGTV
ncbi:MAG: hypothetical protein ACOYW3_01115, partial [Bacteroidota bacterium]